MAIVTDPKTGKKKWMSDVDVPGSPGWKAEQEKRRRQMEEDRKRTREIRLGKTEEEEKAEKELEERQKEFLPVAEETGVFEERPERVELDVKKEEKLAEQGFVRKVTGIAKPTLFGETSKIAASVILGDKIKDPETKIADLIQNPETLRAKMLQEIQREELDKSQTASQKLGALLEPIVGDLKVFDIDIGRYADKFLRMPKQEVEEIVEQIKEIESSASGLTDAASQGEIGNPAAVLRDIAEKEEQVYILEARIKRLILESDELKANPEQVNLIEKEILTAKETLFEARQRAAEGAVLTPSDSQLYFKLQELRNEK